MVPCMLLYVKDEVVGGAAWQAVWTTPLERPLGAQASGFPDIPGRDPVRGDHPYGVTSIDDEAGVGSLVSTGFERVCGRGVDGRDTVGGGVVREGSGRAPSAGVAVGGGQVVVVGWRWPGGRGRVVLLAAGRRLFGWAGTSGGRLGGGTGVDGRGAA